MGRVTSLGVVVLENTLDASEGVACQIVAGAVKAAPVTKARRLFVLRKTAESVYRELLTEGSKALTEPVADESELPDEVTAAYELAKLNSIGVQDELYAAEGGAVSSAECGRRLGGLSAETVRNYYNDGRLIAWRRDRKNLRFPVWQIHKGGILPGLDQVLECAKAKGWTTEETLSFLLNPRDVLKGRRPLDLMRAGEVDAVIRAAAQEGDIGA